MTRTMKKTRKYCSTVLSQWTNLKKLKSPGSHQRFVTTQLIFGKVLRGWNIGDSATQTKRGEFRIIRYCIISFNNCRNSSFRNSQCNTIQGSFDGTMFPRNVTTGAKEKFRVYRVAFCRTLPIEYLREGSEYGIRAHFYKLSENAFDDSLDDPESMCFCSTDKVCMKRGLGNITPCYYSREKVEGLSTLLGI